MASWKKVITSGSAISQLINDAGYLIADTIPNGFSTASFEGTHILANTISSSLNFASESGAGLTISADAGTDKLSFGLSAIPNTSLANSTISGVALGDALYELTFGNGLYAGAYSGSEDTTISVNSSSMQAYFNSSSWAGVSGVIEIDGSGISTFTSTAGDLISGSFTSVSSSIAVDIASNGASITSINAFTQSANTSITSLNAFTESVNISITSINSFTESVDASITSINAFTESTDISITALNLFTGSANTSITAINLFTGSANTSITALNTFTGSITGTANEIIVTSGGNALIIGLPDDVIIGNDLTVEGDLIVNGALTYINVDNLFIKDQWILLASGSGDGTDSGFVVERATNGTGAAFGWDESAERWGLSKSGANAETNLVEITAYVSAVIPGDTDEDLPSDDSTTSQYVQKGNMFIGDDTSIWIYS